MPSSSMVTSLLSMSDDFKVNIPRIMLVDFQPPAFLLTPFVLTF